MKPRDGCVVVLGAILWAAVLPAAYSSELAVLCARGEVSAVRDILSGGAIPDEIDEEGYTPLMRTVLAGLSAPLSSHLEIIELLCQARADVNAEAGGLTSLHRAVAKGSKFLDMTLLLLEKGANPSALGAWGTPLHVALRPDVHPDHVRLLLRWGADVNAPNRAGIVPLVEAVMVPDPSLEKVVLLLDAGADANSEFEWNDRGGLRVLMAAAVNSAPEIVQLLLDRGALRSSRDKSHLSAYDYAVLAKREDNANLLR